MGSIIHNFGENMAKMITNEQAIALHLKTTAGASIGHALNQLVHGVREILKNPILTVREIKDILENWIKMGWVKWHEAGTKYIQILERGHYYIDNLASQAV